jgi:SAM-dependent methyltransferase
MPADSSLDPTERFSNRVDYYIRYRPRYPAAVLDFLKAELSLSPQALIADIGSGTGILAEMLLRNGNPVFGVEPNPEMRAAAEALLNAYPHFHSVSGRAEATTLAATSVDVITAGQAFHWFQTGQARQEFRRILKPGGWVVLVWNDRRPEASPFMRAYEQLLWDYAGEYEEVSCHNANQAVLADFFDHYTRRDFPNYQEFDHEGLRGRLLSSSYAPLPGHPQYEPMLAELRRIFEANQSGGLVRFVYETEVYYGRL